MIGTSILSTIVLLGVLIFVHELGHFLTAKYFNVGVLKFSLGFGKKLYSRKIGETEYCLSLIPLGGYVKLLGEAEGDELTPEEEKRSFLRQNVWRRILIVAAGPAFNFLLAVLIFAAVQMIGLPVLTAQIGKVLPDSAASRAGLQTQDRVVAIDGQPVSLWDDVALRINAANGKTLSLTILREEKETVVAVTPQPMSGKNLFGETVTGYKIGITPAGTQVTLRKNPAEAVWMGAVQTWMVAKLTVMSIVKMIEGVVSPKSLGGPILIAQMAGTHVKEGAISFILFMALLSVNLGVLNLLPIPILDGGHLFFYLLEAIRGKAVGLAWRERAQQVGFALLMLLMIYVMIADIDRLNLKVVDDFVRAITGQP